jgi:glycosyl transferase family 25
MYKIYVVNLKKSKERRLLMESQLRKLQLTYEFIEAIDAGHYDQNYIDSINQNRSYFKDLRKGEIACAESHIKAMEKGISDGCDFMLILEDDVIISKKITEILPLLTRVITNNEAILLCALTFSPTHFQKNSPLDGSFSLHTCDDLHNLFGSQAYFLSSNTAKRMVNFLSPVKSIADDWKRLAESFALDQIRILLPFPVQHAELLSDINTSNEDANFSMRTRLKKIFYEKRIFPLYQLFLYNRRKKSEKIYTENIYIDGSKIKQLTKIE